MPSTSAFPRPSIATRHGFAGRSRWIWAGAVALWAAGAAGGLGILTAEGSQAGAAATPPATLAATGGGAGTAWLAGGPTASAHLVLVAHPMCPCTRASLRVLERVASRAGASSVDIVVLFASGKHDRITDDLRDLARRIPGARLVDDPSGAMASALGVRTSGSVAFYDHTGALRFSGGITPSRGHEGDSAAQDALSAAIAADHASLATPSVSTVPASSSSPRAPVFGCALFSLRDPHDDPAPQPSSAAFP